MLKPYNVAQLEIIIPKTKLLINDIRIVLNESAVKRLLKYSAIFVVEINWITREGAIKPKIEKYKLRKNTEKVTPKKRGAARWLIGSIPTEMYASIS